MRRRAHALAERERARPRRRAAACTEYWLCLREITERKRAELDRERRDRILEAVAFGAARLLEPGTWAARADEVLARLGEAAEVARAWFGEKTQVPDGRRGSRSASWARRGHEVGLDDPRIRGGVPLRDLGLQPHLAALEAGRPLAALVRDMAPCGAGLLDAHGLEVVRRRADPLPEALVGCTGLRRDALRAGLVGVRGGGAQGGGGGGREPRSSARGRTLRCARARSASSACRRRPSKGSPSPRRACSSTPTTSWRRCSARRSPT